MKNHWFKNAIDSIAERGRELLGLDQQPQKADLETQCQQLLLGQGEASGIALSQDILQQYQLMDDEQKLAFFHLLEEAFQPDFDNIQSAVEHYQETRSAEDLIALGAAVEAPRQELFRRLNMAPEGTASLVALRADLIKCLKEYPSLKSVDADLKHLLSSWFNRGFLQLRSIDWRSPAHILEKLISYEAVHEIQGWDDLRRRMMEDRRCFAFFHPAMPDEPLIFVEVAFVQGLSDEVTNLLDPNSEVLDLKQTDTAIFYSINNTQAGLRGISFGNFLIKQVLVELTQACPWLKTSSTLSPVPSFRNAIDHWLNSGEETPQHAEFDTILQQHRSGFDELCTKLALDKNLDNKKLLSTMLEYHLNKNNTALGDLLIELGLSYLTFPKANGKLADPVATFHLSNGARMERLNAFADLSEHGIATSYGVMVNYLYDLNAVEVNHEEFMSKGHIVISEPLHKLFKKFDRKQAP